MAMVDTALSPAPMERNQFRKKCAPKTSPKNPLRVKMVAHR